MILSIFGFQPTLKSLARGLITGIILGTLVVLAAYVLASL